MSLPAYVSLLIASSSWLRIKRISLRFIHIKHVLNVLAMVIEQQCHTLW